MLVSRSLRGTSPRTNRRNSDMYRLTRSAYLIVVTLPLGSIALEAQVAGGVTAGAFTWEDGRREQALGTVFQVAPARWLLLGAVPTLLRVQSSPAADPRFGVGDLPVYAALVHAGRGATRPTLALTASASLPTGDSDRGLGRGVSVVSSELAAGIDPAPGLTLRAGGARLLRVAGESPQGLATSTIFGDVVVGSGAQTSISLGAFGELRGDAPAVYEPARGMSAAIAHTLRSGPTVVLGAGRSLAGVGPTWSFSLGIGTAFAGVAPVGATAPVSRATGGLPRGGRSLTPPLCAIAAC
jgi:hypothetical protein